MGFEEAYVYLNINKCVKNPPDAVKGMHETGFFILKWVGWVEGGLCHEYSGDAWKDIVV